MKTAGLITALLIACLVSAEPSRNGPKTPVGERRQIFRDDVENLKINRPSPVPYHDGEEYEGPQVYPDNYQPSPYRPAYEDNYKPAYQQKPVEYEEQYRRPYSPPQQYEKPSYKPSNKPVYDAYEPAYEAPYKPAPKPYKPRPEYPKEIVLLTPSPALKASSYTTKYVSKNYNQASSVPGTAGRDYPNYDAVPATSFDCLAVRHTDYNYMFPDSEAGCQVFHSCHEDGRQDSFLCPLGTIFDAETQTCDWWYNVRCAKY